MPTLQELHAKWSVASEAELEDYITRLQRRIILSEAHVLPRARASLAASTKHARGNPVSENHSDHDEDTASPPPADLDDLRVFLSRKAELLELYATLATRRHITQLKSKIENGDANACETGCCANMVRYLSESAGKPLVSAQCVAQMGVPRTNTSLLSDNLLSSLAHAPEVAESEPKPAAEATAAAAAEGAQAQGKAEEREEVDALHVPFPHILRVPMSEDNDFVLNLDLCVDLPAAAFDVSKASTAQSGTARGSLSMTPEVSFLSGDQVSAEGKGSSTTSLTPPTALAPAGTTFSAFTPEHFLWTMQQVPFTLSYIYGVNELSATTTRTAYATITSSSSSTRARSKTSTRHKHEETIVPLFSEESLDAAMHSTAGSSSAPHERGSTSPDARHLHTTSCSETSSTGADDDDEDGVNSSCEEEDDEVVRRDMDRGAEGRGLPAPRGHRGGGGGGGVPTQRDGTCAPDDGLRQGTPPAAAKAMQMVCVRLRVSFPSVRFVVKPEPLSLHGLLISQPATRYGTPVQISVLVVVLPPPVTIFRSVMSAPIYGTDVTAHTQAPDATQMERRHVDEVPVQGREGTAKAYLIIEATDLLHSVDFSVRTGDTHAGGRSFIMYSKEFLGLELAQYLLPSDCETRRSSPLVKAPQQYGDSTASASFDVLRECAHGQEEWAIPVILPYRLPPHRGELEVSLHLDVRFCCQPHRSFREVFAVRLFEATRSGEKTAAASSSPHRRGSGKSPLASLTPHTVAAAAAAPPPISTQPLHSPPQLVRSRLPSTLIAMPPTPSDVEGISTLLRMSPQAHASAPKLISTSLLHVMSFSLCDGGALVVCAERVKGRRPSRSLSTAATPHQSPTTSSLALGNPASRSRRHRHKYRSFLGFSPTNVMNSCVRVDAVVMVPPHAVARLVEAGSELVRFLRPEGTRSRASRASTAATILTGSEAGNDQVESRIAATPTAVRRGEIDVTEYHVLDLRYVMARGWVFEMGVGEPHAHNTAVLRDKSNGQCLVLRVDTDALDAHIHPPPQRRDVSSLHSDAPLCPGEESKPHHSSWSSAPSGVAPMSAGGGTGGSLEVILYVSPQSSSAKVAAQQFVSDELALLTRSVDGDLFWWKNVTNTTETLVSDCRASHFWELENADGLTLVVVALGPRCTLSDEGVPVLALASPGAHRSQSNAHQALTDAVTVGVYCLEERRLVYHFDVMGSDRPTESVPRHTMNSGIEVISRKEETGAVLYWNTESVVVLRCGPEWSHHEIFHVSSVTMSTKGGRSPVGTPAGADPEDKDEPVLLAASTRSSSATPSIVSVTTTTSLNITLDSHGGSASAPSQHQWLAFVLLSDGRIVGLRYAALEHRATPSPDLASAGTSADQALPALPSPAPHASIIGTVFNPTFVNPAQRVRDIVMCYYSIESQVMRRWSPLQSYTSRPPGADATSPFDVPAASQAQSSQAEAASAADCLQGPVGVIYLYGVEIASNRLLKDAVLVEA